MESKEHFEVLLEDIKGMVGLVLEGHAGLNKKIDNLDQKMDDFRKENDFAHKEIFKELKKLHKQDEAQEKVNADLEKRVSCLEAARI